MSLRVLAVAATLGFLALGLGVIALQVDDWGRDLTTNVAETLPSARDPLLRPLTASASRVAAVAAVERSAATLPRWSRVRTERGDSATLVHLVRSSRLFRFKDDVTVRVTDREAGCLITARSASRVGKGDLGQNPRNLKELLGRVRRELEAVAGRTGSERPDP